MSASLSPIVLFDIDGTVLTYDGPPPGPGRTALELAMRELYAFHGATDGLRVAGGTDKGLARSLLRRAALAESDEAIAKVIASYMRNLSVVLETRRYRPIGDVSGVVGALQAQGAVVGLATGNVRHGAGLKLASAGLEATFDLARGGFGCDAEPRAEIVRAAIVRCAPHAPAGAPIVVIGDTEYDVQAARAVGARIIGLARNAETRDALVAAGADAIVDTCGDALLRAVLS